MRKTFKYRIYPTKKQTQALETTIQECRELYNAALQERISAYKTGHKSISLYQQSNQLPDIKKDRPEFKQVHSQVLQDVLSRLDKAFANFFGRVKKGETPGFPRFKGKHRYNSFTYAQSGFSIKNNKLVLSKIGQIKIVLHRPIEGTVKTCTVKRMPTGKWFVLFSCEVEPKLLSANPESVGIDLGLTNFVAASTGELIASPKFFRQEEKALAKVQRKLSATPKGTKQRAQRRKIVARVHERISNKRENFAHQLSFVIVVLFGVIVFEDLTIKNMIKNGHLSKSIADVAWKQLVTFTGYKAEKAGRTVILVDPRHTSLSLSRVVRFAAM